MTDLRKAAEMALEFVSWFASDDHSIKPKHKAPEIAEALRQALAQHVDAAIVAEVGIWGEENLHDHVDTVTNSTNPVQNPHKHKENT